MKSKIALLLALFMCFISVAQESPDTEEDADEVAKKLANPNAVIGFFTFPIDWSVTRCK